MKFLKLLIHPSPISNLASLNYFQLFTCAKTPLSLIQSILQHPGNPAIISLLGQEHMAASCNPAKDKDDRLDRKITRSIDFLLDFNHWAVLGKDNRQASFLAY